MFVVVLLHYHLPLAPLTRPGFFNVTSEIFEPKALNFPLVDLICIQESKLNSFSYPTLFGSLDTLLCDLVAITPGLAFFLLMTSTSAVVSLFSSSRAYPSMNFLPPLSRCLTSTLTVRSTSHKITLPRSFLSISATTTRSSSTDSITDSFFFSCLSFSRNLLILGDFHCQHLLWGLKGTSDPVGRK